MATIFLSYLLYLIEIALFYKVVTYPLRRCYETISNLFINISTRNIPKFLLTASKFLLSMAGLVAGIWGGVMLGACLSSYLGINSLLGIAFFKIGAACWGALTGAFIGTGIGIVAHLFCEKICDILQREKSIEEWIEEWDKEQHGLDLTTGYASNNNTPSPSPPQSPKPPPSEPQSPKSPLSERTPSPEQFCLTGCKSTKFAPSFSSPLNINPLTPQNESTHSPG